MSKENFDKLLRGKVLKLLPGTVEMRKVLVKVQQPPVDYRNRDGTRRD